MIPKIIHYCWFGGGEMPPVAYKCIESWRRFLPDYEIKRWDESNFDVNLMPYVSDAYNAKKYTIVSDVARLWIIYNYGGIYLDIDVEIIASLDDVLDKGGYIGIENHVNKVKSTGELRINSGLGFAADKESNLIGDMLEKYKKALFYNNDGTQTSLDIFEIVQSTLIQHGLKASTGIQEVDDITIYPWDYFCPIDYESGEITITSNTRTIHHFTSLWLSPIDRKANEWRWKLKWLPYPLNAGLGRIIAVGIINPGNFFKEIKDWILAKYSRN